MRPYLGLLPRISLHVLACVGFCFPVTLHAADTKSAVRPLQTELLGPLDIARVHPGSTVLVRVDLDWTDSTCHLRAGSIVEGHVTQVVKRSKTVKNSEIHLLFDAAACEGKPGTPHTFALVALVGPAGGSSETGQSGVSEAPPLADAVGLSISGGFRSVETASNINNSVVSPTRSLPSQILPGQVVDIRKMNLSIGTGVDGATVIVALGHDARLEHATSLILVARPAQSLIGAGAATPTGSVAKVTGATGGSISAPAGGTSTSSSPAPVQTAAVEPPDETDICSGVCNVIGTPGAGKLDATNLVSASLSIGQLGYAPRVKRQVPSFDDETTLTYLDAHNLLCTFDPHQLRQRPGTNEEVSRTIRAVLIDPDTHSIKRVLEWRVRGDNQYLWRLSGGRVLVHMGHQLRLFDAALMPLRSVDLVGRVAWVVSSPTSNHIAVGTVKERYAEFVHRDLDDRISEQPDEDVEVRVFDSNFQLQFTTHRSSRTATPVLSDVGELRVHANGHNRWKLAEYGWDKTERTIASTKSTCRPVLSVPAQGLIFAVGCTASGGRWYRMLGPDGHPLLKGESPSNEIEQSALGATDAAFAVRIVKAAKSMSYHEPFNRSDLEKEEIAVFRKSDGATLSAVSSNDFALSQLGYALSPSGDQMALIGNDAIRFYAIKTARP